MIFRLYKAKDGYVLPNDYKYVKKYTDIVDVFKLLVNPDEIFTFYQINHTLVKSNYSLNSIMKMIPAERGFVLKLIEKDKQ